MKDAGFKTRVKPVAVNYIGIGYVVYTGPRARTEAPKGSPSPSTWSSSLSPCCPGPPRTLAPLVLLALLAMTAAWGSTFFLIKDVVTRIPVTDLLALRFAIATVGAGACPGASCG